MHMMKTTIVKITSYAPAKEAVTRNANIVTFFNLSHYWGGQLAQVRKSANITRGLCTNTKSRFYTLVL